ncbi:FecR domain-containing protein [Paenibacillus sp. FSL K6-1230]|uniref:FecR domain-containing protein n=1 Tax=Paenibacillus sp. FSL K6-1230 TaxID=2921603 RepID=UPI0030F5E7AD
MIKIPRVLMLFLVISVLITGSYGVSAAAFESGGAYLASVKGEVSVTKAGGAQAIPAFDNMKLSQGDQIITGDNGSVTIKVKQPESERTLGHNSNATITKLSQSASGNTFSIKLWNGSMWSSVASLGGADQDTIETPGSTLRVKGTQFYVGIQSDGTLSVFVASGLVAASFDDYLSPASPILIAPTQQLNVNALSLPAQLQDAVSVVDVTKLANQADPVVLQAMISSAAAITSENDELRLQLQRSLGEQVQPALQRGGISSDISIKGQEDLDTYLMNINNLVSNIASEAVRLGKIQSNAMNEILNQVNREIPNIDQKIRLNPIQSINPLGGVDSGVAQQKEQELLRLEAFRKEAEQKQLRLQSEIKAKLGETMQQLLSIQQELNAANQSILEQLQSEAEKMYISQLSADQLASYQQNKQQLKNESSSSPSTQNANTNTNTTAPAIPDRSNSRVTPDITLVQDKTAQGFNLSIHFKRFTGSNAFYGTEFHFVSDNNLEVVNPDNRFLNESYFASTNSVDLVKSQMGTVGSSAATKKEIIYAATQFGNASNITISDGVLATIPFSVTGDGTLKLSYVKIVDKTGKVVLELNDPNPGLPPVLTFTK